ncbi:lysyl-tRNA synthetase [Streptococcus pseudopneumoniae]|nr:lysyl-tRNA synthetase [Streptococcus pseudopneumoniae]
MYGKTTLTWFEEIFEEYKEVAQRRFLMDNLNLKFRT